MFKTLKQIVIGALMGTLIATMATGQTLLPNAKQQYLDAQGNPVVAGTIDYFVPGGNIRKNTWTNPAATNLSTNPVILDAEGRPQPTGQTFGSGSYRQVVKDTNGNTIWDAITQSTDGGGGGGGTATVGDGDPVGSIKWWPGLVLPYGYLYAYGQELLRGTYPELFAAIVSQQNGTCTLGNPTLSGLADTSQLPIGAKIESTCFNSGSTITAKTISTITSSSNAIISTTTTNRFFPWGNGNGTTTFNAPDMRGRVPLGRTNMGNSVAARVSQAFYGTDPSAVGAGGGNQGAALATSNLPPYTPSGVVGISNTGSVTVMASGGTTNTSGGGNPTLSGLVNTSPFASAVYPLTINSTTSFTGAAQGGTSAPFSILQPAVTGNFIVKVTPDSNPNTFFGVASIGGMYGVLTCGLGVVCAGNEISVIPNAIIGPPTSVVLGGVYAKSCSSSNWVNGIDTAGNVVCSQPNFSDLVGSISISQVPNNLINNLKLSQAPAGTFKGNPTGALANIQDVSISALVNLPVPDSNLDYLMIWDHTTNTLKNITPNQLPGGGGGGGGVTSFAGVTGSISIGNGLAMTGPTVSVSLPVSTLTATGSITGANKIVLCDATSGNVVLTIPTAASILNGQTITVKRKDNSANTCVVQVSGGGLLDNLSSLGVEPQFSSYTLASDGSATWWVQ